jgi:histidinol dehydrogenase
VGIDAPAGPSELLVVADASADPEVIVREMLAQAEHDVDACVVCVTVGDEVAAAVEQSLRVGLKLQSRARIIEAALAARGALLTAGSLDAALGFAEAYAPEHLLLAVDDPEALLPRVRNAGTVFLGSSASVTFGDYMTGANHVLPTGALARSYSGLSTGDFVRWTTYQRVSPAAAARLASDVASFATAEGLTAHADAARAWLSASIPVEVTT